MVKEANVLWSYKFEDGRQVAAWDKLRLNPESTESSFCIVRGQGEKDQPMIERISDVLLQSTECLATEEHNYHRAAGLRGVRFYFPVIITTAKLKACKCDFSKVDLSTGQIPDADFEDVPFIRFTKSMPTQLASSNSPKDVGESNRESQRTVFVFNANSLAATLLSAWEFEEPKYSTELWPWELSLWKKEIKYNNSIRND